MPKLTDKAGIVVNVSEEHAKHLRQVGYTDLADAKKPSTATKKAAKK